MIDYTDKLNCIAAHGKENNVLILRKLNNTFKRFDGKNSHYELEYRWLSCECKHENDEAWACCQVSDFIYLTNREVKPFIKKQDNLFNHFNLF